MAKILIKSEKLTPFGGIFFYYGAFWCSFVSDYRFCFGADCGSYSKEIIEVVEAHCKRFYVRANRCSSLYDTIFALRGWKTVDINCIEFELNSILIKKRGKPYRLVIQRQKRKDSILDLWEGEYIYRCILTFWEGYRWILQPTWKQGAYPWRDEQWNRMESDAKIIHERECRLGRHDNIYWISIPRIEPILRFSEGQDNATLYERNCVLLFVALNIAAFTCHFDIGVSSRENSSSPTRKLQFSHVKTSSPARWYIQGKIYVVYRNVCCPIAGL